MQDSRNHADRFIRSIGAPPRWWRDHGTAAVHLSQCALYGDKFFKNDPNGFARFMEAVVWAGRTSTTISTTTEESKSPLEANFLFHLVERLAAIDGMLAVVVLPPCRDFPKFKAKVLAEYAANPSVFPPTLQKFHPLGNKWGDMDDPLLFPPRMKTLWPVSGFLTLQPAFPSLLVGNPARSVRPDALFWNLQGVQVVLECDSMTHHKNSEDAFERDRQRSEALQLEGYPTLQFSGREITDNPRGVAHRVSEGLMKLVSASFEASPAVCALVDRLLQMELDQCNVVEV